MRSKIRLLLVEDERTLSGIIRDTLSDLNFDVEVAYNGGEALILLKRGKWDIVVTDIMMPTMDGFTFVEHLRRTDSTLPVIFLSARSSAEDVVRGFELGAGDYLRKPFAISELIVRIRSLLGRNDIHKEEQTTTYTIGIYTFDPMRSILQYSSESLVLSGRESELLLYLIRNQGKVVPLSTILLDLWGNDDYFTARSLHVYVTKLRHRLSKDPALSIVNIRGIGYKLLCKI